MNSENRLPRLLANALRIGSTGALSFAAAANSPDGRQATDDIRLPQEEAAQVVKIPTKNGRTGNAHYDEADGHGFSKRENLIDIPPRPVDWFRKYLKGEPSSPGAK